MVSASLVVVVVVVVEGTLRSEFTAKLIMNLTTYICEYIYISQFNRYVQNTGV